MLSSQAPASQAAGAFNANLSPDAAATPATGERTETSGRPPRPRLTLPGPGPAPRSLYDTHNRAARSSDYRAASDEGTGGLVAGGQGRTAESLVGITLREIVIVGAVFAAMLVAFSLLT